MDHSFDKSGNIAQPARAVWDDAHALVDAEGVVVACDDRFVELIGNAYGSVLGKPFAALCPGALHDVGEGHAANGSGGPGAHRIPFQPTADGKTVVLSIQPLRTVEPGSLSIVSLSLIEGENCSHAELSCANESTEESESRFRTYVENAPDALFVSSQEGAILDVNARACQSLGYTRDELLGLTVFDIECERSREQILQCARANTEGSCEIVRGIQLRKDGSRFPVELHLTSLQLGGERCMLILAHDITQRTRTEAALRESEARYRALFDTLSEGVVYRNQHFEILDVNPAAESILGLTREELCSGKAPNFIWPDGRPLQLEELPGEQVFRTGEPVRDVLLGIKRSSDGETRWLRESAVPIRTSDDLGLQIYVSFEDVTDCIRIEKALQASEARYRVYVDQAVDALFVHDSEGRLVDVNQQACRSLGYSRDELLKMTVMDIDPEFPLERARKVWTQNAPGWNTTVLGVHQRKDGSRFPVEIRVGSFQIEDQRIHFGFARDITERHRTEENLRQKEELLRLTGQMAKVGGWELDVTTQEGRFTEEVRSIHDLVSINGLTAEAGLQFYTDSSRSILGAALHEAMTLGTPYDLELDL